MKIEKTAKGLFWGLDETAIEDIVSEARCIQWTRHGNLLDHQAGYYIRKIVLQAARDLGYLTKEVSFGKEAKVGISWSSLDQLQEDEGFEPADDEPAERPEAAVDRILPFLPDGSMRQVFMSLLDEEFSSIEQAAKAHNLPPQSVFDALRRIGTLFRSYEEDGDLLAARCSEKGLKAAVARICSSLKQRVPAQETPCWEQGGLF